MCSNWTNLASSHYIQCSIEEKQQHCRPQNLSKILPSIWSRAGTLEGGTSGFDARITEETWEQCTGFPRCCSPFLPWAINKSNIVIYSSNAIIPIGIVRHRRIHSRNFCFRSISYIQATDVYMMGEVIHITEHCCTTIHVKVSIHHHRHTWQCFTVNLTRVTNASSPATFKGQVYILKATFPS